MRDPALRLLDELRPSCEGSRLLLTGWFSFLDGEATAGDVLAQRQVSATLERSGIGHDTAWSPGFRPGGRSLEEADPSAYDRLLFVCGPVHGDQLVRLHDRFASCRRYAWGVTVVDPGDPAVTGFHRVVARDGTASPPLRDLSATAPLGCEPPVVAVVLTEGQGEYGARRRHAELDRTLTEWIGRTDCSRVELDTRLALDWRHCATPEQYMALARRMDVVLTTRLHGMVLALRAGTPALAVDPVQGGAKVSAQARALRWPAVLGAEEATPAALETWWSWCLSPAGRAAAGRRARLMHREGGRAAAYPS
ncbi:polysaccharide pyruvyl transferase [Streptomyces sulfonofaciens]|uniref:Polysaccharide pyruvyl transferase n=1 Tax=Streptomyces sulfonofaciens TaxID=68272 RepID=A0A919GN36_9ACTN|nr:polysaccharide pyruvyl transferase family protein [Streptomyces sulfonofaciens]GHH87647.1 polysaccharide pyruvyl transferase [Streptomyces sulfonofaciens]